MIARAAPRVVAVSIPGVPVAQGRGRAVRFGNSVRVIDPSKSRSWKGAAQVFMLQARQAAGMHAPHTEPLRLVIDAYWPRPKSTPKRAPAGAIPRPSRPDADNVAKAVMDAGNGILWADDSLVVDLVVRKWVHAAGGEPRVEVTAETCCDRPATGKEAM